MEELVKNLDELEINSIEFSLIAILQKNNPGPAFSPLTLAEEQRIQIVNFCTTDKSKKKPKEIKPLLELLDKAK